MRWLCLLLLPLFFSGCGVYSFSGASIEGKTIRFGVLENRARNVVPTLSPTLTDKIRGRILSQTGLTPKNSGPVDYDLTGTIMGMIKSFRAVSQAGAAEKAQMLSDGISEALHCTAFGLIVAIIAILFYGYFQGKNFFKWRKADQQAVLAEGKSA